MAIKFQKSKAKLPKDEQVISSPSTDYVDKKREAWADKALNSKTTKTTKTDGKKGNKTK